MKYFNDIWNRIVEMYATKSEPEGLGRLADIYWRTVLSLCFIIIVLALLYGVSDLLGVLSDLGTPPNTSGTPPSPFNRNTLDGLVQAFQARQQQYDALSATPSAPVLDPSK